MNLIEINALKRTGHHAFTNWLISNLINEESELFSSIESPQKYNFIDGGSSNKILWINEGEVNINDHITYINNYPKNINTVIITYEGVRESMGYNPLYSILSHKDSHKLSIKNHTQITFIRNFYNNISSLCKASSLDWFKEQNWNLNVEGIYGNHVYNICKIQLKDYLEGNKGVLYDKWISDEEYTNEVCLKLLNKPNKYNPLEIKGTSSSWKNEELNVDNLLNRYKTGLFPTWIVKKLVEDIEMSTMLNKAFK